MIAHKNTPLTKKEIQARNQRIANAKRQRQKNKKQFYQLKECQDLMDKNATSVQKTIEIKKVAPNGIFEVGDNLYSRQYLLNDLNYVTKSFNEQRSFFGGWERVINAIDAILFEITVFNKNRDLKILKEKILYQHQNDGFDLKRDCYNDIIEKKIIDGKNGVEQVKFLTITIKRLNYNDALASFKTMDSNIVREFGTLGSTLIPLTANERFEVIHNFYRMGDESKFDMDILDYLTTGQDWRNDISCNYINFTEDPGYFRTERKFGKAMCISPSTWPDDELSDDFFSDLINVNMPSIFTLSYVPISKSATKNELENRYMASENKIRKQQQKRNKNKDFSSDISYVTQKENEEIKDMLDDVRDNGQKMYWVGLNMVILGDTLDKLDENTDSINVKVENIGCLTDEFLYRQREAINSTLPIGVRNVTEMRNMFTRMACVLIPFRTMELQQKNNPMYYGTNKESKEPIFLNRKNLVNANGFVFGVTGGGKSFTGAKLEMGSVWLTTDDDIIVLDPTHEYLDVCEGFNGTFIEMSTESPHHINPFHCNVKELTRNNYQNYVAQKTQIMCGVCEHAMEDEFTSRHRSIVDRCVKQIFLNLLKQSSEKRRVPIMQDFYEILKTQDEPEARDMELSLEIFIDGSMNIFNYPTNIDIDNRLIVYGIRDIGEELESVAMLLVLEQIRQRIIANSLKGRATWLYVDEFHVLMQKKYSRMFLISLWKKVRKLGGICTGITQNLSDVVVDKETHKLISNSEYTMMLRMGAGDDKIIMNTFEGKITAEHIKYIANASPGCGLLRVGNKVLPLDNTIEKTNPIYSIFNTNFYEKMAVKEAGVE